MRKAAILDVDGTACDNTAIIHLLRTSHPDFRGSFPDEYHRRTTECPPNLMVVEWFADRLAEGTAVIVVTARPECYRGDTVPFLDTYYSGYVEYHCRADGDLRPDVEVKAEILADLRTRYEIIGAIDDHPRVAAFFESEGIPTVLVPGYAADPAHHG